MSQLIIDFFLSKTRLNGPHSDYNKAREAIFTYEDRVKKALRTKRDKEERDLGIFDSAYQYLAKFLKNTLHLNNFFVIFGLFVLVLLFWFIAK